MIPDSLKFLENGELFVILDNPAPHRLITLCSPKALISLSMFHVHQMLFFELAFTVVLFFSSLVSILFSIFVQAGI